MAFAAEILQKEAKVPPGVMNIVHGSQETVKALISHPKIKGVTFVGSTKVGREVYRLAGEHGKRAIVQAGAKNSILIMPDANLPEAVESCSSSFFGNAGQRCLAGANLIVSTDVRKELSQKFVKRAAVIKLGYGLDESAEMGPLVSSKARERTVHYVEQGESEGAKLVLDGRRSRVPGYENGYFLGATIFEDVSPDMVIAKDEIFGPVANIIEVPDLDEAIDLINKSTDYGNAASIFTSSVAAPVGYFPFGGMRDSFLGVLHGQMDSVDFFTDRKVIISRWNQ
jgi:malonate-semialdehyde dehydrogenase (acetylating)/methylmalonate-semialdehyde dehydrogenase